MKSILTLALIFGASLVSCATGDRAIGVFGARVEGPEKFNAPYGIAVDSNARLIFVADGPGIKVFDANLKFIKQIGAGHAFPVAVAVDTKLQRAYLVDNLGDSVTTYTYDGRSLRSLGGRGSGGPVLKSPWSVAVDSDSHEIVASDEDNNRVLVFDADGAYLRKIGEPDADKRFVRPTAVAIDSRTHEVFVADSTGVQVFDSRGRYLRRLDVKDCQNGGSSKQIYGLAIMDVPRVVLVSDYGNECIQEVQPDGLYVGHFRIDYPAEGRMAEAPSTPAGIAVLEGGDRIFVVDTAHDRVVILTARSLPSTRR